MLLEEVNTLSSSKLDWSLIISIIALGASMLTYFLHDRRLKRQEHLINDYQIQKISQEQDENNKALVKANVIKQPKGKIEIKVFNAGKSVAKNVNFEILSETKLFSIGQADVFPYEFLNPQEGTGFFIFLHQGAPKVIKVRTTWDDAYKSGNIYEQMLTL